MGAPRDCGPTGRINYQWTKTTATADKNSHSEHIRYTVFPKKLVDTVFSKKWASNVATAQTIPVVGNLVTVFWNQVTTGQIAELQIDAVSSSAMGTRASDMARVAPDAFYATTPGNWTKFQRRIFPGSPVWGTPGRQTPFVFVGDSLANALVSRNAFDIEPATMTAGLRVLLGKADK